MADVATASSCDVNGVGGCTVTAGVGGGGGGEGGGGKEGGGGGMLSCSTVSFPGDDASSCRSSSCFWLAGPFSSNIELLHST
jgi:hypothetical protein